MGWDEMGWASSCGILKEMDMTQRGSALGEEHPVGLEEEECPEGLWVRMGGNQLLQVWEVEAGRPGAVNMGSFSSALWKPLASGRWTWDRLWSSSVRGSQGSRLTGREVG